LTHMASGLRGHQLKVSKRGTVKPAQQNDSPLYAIPALMAGAAPASGSDEGTAAERAAAGRAGMEPAAGEDFLATVWRTSSYLETVQWELDAAHESLRQAVQQASGYGVDRGALLQAANMTPEELAALLDTTPAYPAVS
jgi:hypothetical protein